MKVICLNYLFFVGCFFVSVLGYSQHYAMPRLDYQGDTVLSMQKYIKKHPNEILFFLGYLYSQELEKQTGNQSAYSPPCEEGVLLIKFQVNSKGNVTHVGISQGANPILTELLTKVIKQTSGHWKPVYHQGIKVDSDYILIPFYYNYLSGFGCKENKSKNSLGYLNLLFEFARKSPTIKFNDGAIFTTQQIAQAWLLDTWTTSTVE